MLVGIFIALPVVLYGQFESADRQMRDLVTRAIRDRSTLIAEALAPRLGSLDRNGQATLNAELAKYTSDGTVLKLMFQPGEERHAGRFYFVASAPQPRRRRRLGTRRTRTAWRAAAHLDACMWDAANEIRYRQTDGTVELLTSVIPIRANGGCWVLTSTHTTSDFLNTSIGRPYWETREIRVAAFNLPGARRSWRCSLRSASASACVASGRRRRDQPGPHRRQCLQPSQHVPELASVARDFDKLVRDLREVSRQIRQSAEDKAHSFKTPLATIRSALEPIRRVVPTDNARARRALEIVDSAVSRLLDLVIAAQRHDISTADLLDAPRVPTDVSAWSATRHCISAKSSPNRTFAWSAVSTNRRSCAPRTARSRRCFSACWRTPSASRRAAAPSPWP